MNYSTTGFQLLLTRKMSFYIVTYYLPSGLFVVVSWIRSDWCMSQASCPLLINVHSFLVNPEIIPGRMTLLVTIFLVLINIHNTIQTNSPKVNCLVRWRVIWFSISSLCDLLSGAINGKNAMKCVLRKRDFFVDHENILAKSKLRCLQRNIKPHSFE